MKVLYLQCAMGAAGDMLTAALSELLPAPDAIVARMNGLGLPGVKVEREYKTSAGVRGAHMHVYIHGEEEESCDVPGGDVHRTDAGHAHPHDHVHDHEHEHEHEHKHEHEHEHEHEHHHDYDQPHDHDHGHDHDHHHDHDHGHGHHHHHSSMADIRAMVAAMPVKDKVKEDVLAVYQIIAEAESTVHGASVDEIHFHEVGTMDAVADVTAVCLLLDEIGADRIVCSPVHVGSGMVRCAHGVLPVPAPATALILQGIPCYSGSIEGELCTPTGAALLKHFADSFGPMPTMRVEKIGTGLGTKEFPAANMLRAFLGETETEEEGIEQLSCNLDDCTGEEIGYAFEQLLAAGALDVFTTPIQMKKSRPATLLTVLCRTADAPALTELLLRHTTTLGVRRQHCARTALARRIETRETKFGPVRFKIAEGGGVTRCKPEFEDVARIAREHDLTYREVLAQL